MPPAVDKYASGPQNGFNKFITPCGAVFTVVVATAEPQPAAPKPVMTTLYIPGAKLLAVEDVPTVTLLEFNQV